MRMTDLETCNHGTCKDGRSIIGHPYMLLSGTAVGEREGGWVGGLLACMHAFIHAPSLERAALRRSMSLILAGWLVRRDHTVTQMTKSPQNRKAEKLLPSL